VRIARIGAAVVAATWVGVVVGAGVADAAGAVPDSSTNWAGYVVSERVGMPTSFTSVTATWKQPKSACASGVAGSAFWVGLGGYGDGATGLVQIGADADCTAANEPRYSAWYDMPPSPGVFLKLRIDAGDTVTASVSVNALRTRALVRIANTTTGASFSKTLPESSPDLSSAEWIAEAPAACDRFGCRTVSLANFGSVAFTRIAAVAGGRRGTITDARWTATPVRLVPRSHHRFFSPGFSGAGGSASTAGAAPEALAPDGRSFSILWNAHSSRRPRKQVPVPPSNPLVLGLRR
jgi:Peptidase A4 family